MKLLFLIILFSILSADASDQGLICKSEAKNLVYSLTQKQGDSYQLKILKEGVVPDSCNSRWGCDKTLKLIYSEKLELTTSYDQPQYVLETYKGKRTYIEIVDGEGFLRFLKKNKRNNLIYNTIDLNCND